MYCMKCGAPNDDSARFCIKCGTTLVQARATPPQPPPATIRPEPYQPWPVRPERRRRVPRWLVIFGAVLLALVLLCGAALVSAYFWLGLHRTNQIAEVVPADTPLIISFSPDPRQAMRYGDIEDLQAVLPMFGAVPELRETSEEALADIETEFEIDFQEDVLPWIGGEASVAMMDTEAVGYGDVPPIILAVATRNEKKSDAFLEKVWQAMEREGAEFEKEVYQDIEVTYQVPDYEGSFAPAFATFNHLVVVGADREALHRSIDTANTAGTAVLADQETFKAALGELPANRLGYVYLDGETFLQELESETDLPFKLAAVQSAAASLGLVADGVRLDYVVSYDLDLLGDEEQDARQRQRHGWKTAELMPGEAVASWSDQDPSLLWVTGDALIGLSDAYEYFYDLGTADERAEAMAERTGIHIKDDLLGQLAGEWGLAILPDPTGLLGEEAIPFGVILFAEIEDPREMEETLHGLAQDMEDEGALIQRTEIGQVPCTILEARWDEWGFGYGFMDDVLVVGTSESMLRAAIEGGDEPLADGETFRAVLKELPDGAGSYFFVDVFQASRLAYSLIDPWSREDLDEVQPYLESIQAIGVGASPMDKDGISRGTLFLYTRAEQ